MGVHTNMCVLNRTFAIKQMVKWGKNVLLVRDLTDAMYNPKMKPMVVAPEGDGTHHRVHRNLLVPDHREQAVDAEVTPLSPRPTSPVAS